MLIISHRGNLNGSNPFYENNPCYVMEAMYHGYDCEVDLWETDDGYWLGHDAPKYKIDYHFFINRHLWIHCKNIEALVHLSYDDRLNLFYHNGGIASSTQGFILTAPGLLVSKKSIAIMPELAPNWDIKEAYGVCTDYVNNKWI